MASVGEKLNAEQALLQNATEINKVASTSFHVPKVVDLNDNYDLMLSLIHI